MIIQKLQQVVWLIHQSENEFLEMVTKQSKDNADKKLKEAKKEFESAKARISKLDEIIQSLYEDKLSGTISADRFIKLSSTYENEQNELNVRIQELDRFLKNETDKLVNAEAFVSKVKKYTDIQELDCEILRELVSKVLVHKVEKTDGHRKQRIDVIFNGLEGIDFHQ